MNGSESLPINYSAILGLIGSILLGIPAFRLELLRRKYHRHRVSDGKVAECKSKKEKKLTEVIEEYMIKTMVLSWNAFDSACVFAGLFFLALSFFLEFF